MKFILKLIGTFIIVHLTCVIIDVICLGGFVMTAHVLSDFSLKNLICFFFLVSVSLTIVSFILQFTWTVGYVFCSNKSKVAATLLTIYSVFRFLNYCVPVLSGESEEESLSELIAMAQDDAGGLYTLGVWTSIVFAFIFYAIMCIFIWSFSLDEE